MPAYIPYQLCTSAHATLINGSACGCRWVDAGKFLTGFSAIGSVAVPAILFHAQVQQNRYVHNILCLDSSLARLSESHFQVTAHLLCLTKWTQLAYCQCLYVFTVLQKITAGALWTELAAVAVLGATVFAFDFFSSSDSGYYTY